MPIEMAIYLAIGVCVCTGMLVWSYFFKDKIDGGDLFVSLMMIPLWPLGVITGLIVLVVELDIDNFVIIRRKKNG